ncbi:MAG: hypothetical protein WKF52_00975 [Sphingomicrobium sp.]
MAKRDDGLTGPVSTKQRIQELDVLRGIALFGVLVMNFIGFAGEGVMTTEAQAAALPSAALDQHTYWGVRWLIGDKANTVFATLFGLGFYLQLQRGEGRPGFEARYRRRLFWLLVFGLITCCSCGCGTSSTSTRSPASSSWRCAAGALGRWSSSVQSRHCTATSFRGC